MPPRRTRRPEALDPGAQLSTLAALSKDEIIERFRAVYGCDPPRWTRREVLVRAVAHRIQENAQGGPDPALHRRLARMADALRRTGSITTEAPSSLIKPGTRLLRTWNGETHSVTVTDAGFVYRDTAYRSLSVIARVITGTRWSGPAFFGLTKGTSPPRDAMADTEGVRL